MVGTALFPLKERTIVFKIALQNYIKKMTYANLYAIFLYFYSFSAYYAFLSHYCVYSFQPGHNKNLYFFSSDNSKLLYPIKICSVSFVSFVSFIYFFESFGVILNQIYPQTDNTDNTDMLFFGGYIVVLAISPLLPVHFFTMSISPA